ncbi:hypothetical protein FQ775_03405 [Nitratireductor mangrovi]|uniref:Uncharacterized protein n=1 Tax=Nitratireductor mangrovi TaxID=2599600 RepID=A0A5B8KV56_9HYPH|nr:hypothetical protein [Nitratireductor mangrovi]QDY99494.1 hypothetical protein FQ775_03405 [Nitratireductor mangrovi]
MLDWMDAMAIAFCIAPTAALWGAFDSDREKQLESGQERGWLRLELTSDTKRLGTLTGWTGKPFQVGRLVMDAQGGEKVTRRKGERTADYRRSCLTKTGGPAKVATRTSFIHACTALAKHMNPDLPANWADIARARWEAADETHRIATRLEEENS